MASRREEKERLRRARLEAEQQASAAARKRILLGYVVAGILAIAVIGGAIFAIASGGSPGGGASDSANVNTRFGALPDGLDVDDREGAAPAPVANGDLKAAAKAAKCDLKLDLPDEGNRHFTNINNEPDYGTNPPTSGPHYFSPVEAGSGALADGAFLETPPFNRLVHSLEHGRIEIQYSSDLSEQDQLALKGVFDADRPGVDLFPNDKMPYAVAATAWTQLLGCKSYEGPATLDAIRDFRDQFRGRGPENIQF